VGIDSVLDGRADRTGVVCHEWLTTFGGSELVAARLAELIGAEDVYTVALREELAAELMPDARVHSTALGRSGFAQRRWQWLLPIMPAMWKRFDLSEADLVVTSSHACANSIRRHNGQVRVSYCYTPMRYAWFWREELGRFPAVVRPVWPVVAAVLRWRDKVWSTRVDSYVGISTFSAGRIKQCYGIEAQVVHPPVELSYWTPDDAIDRDDSFLVAGRMVAYKRPDLAVRAANESGRSLVVAGSGPMWAELTEMAGPTVEFVHAPSRSTLRTLYRRAGAIVYPQVEEFGITLVEAAGCGTPALARGVGGALDTVVDGVTGEFFEDDDDLVKAMGSFDMGSWDHVQVSELAKRFDASVFDDAMREVIASAIEQHSPRSDRDQWAASFRPGTLGC